MNSQPSDLPPTQNSRSEEQRNQEKLIKISNCLFTKKMSDKGLGATPNQG